METATDVTAAIHKKKKMKMDEEMSLALCKISYVLIAYCV